MTVDQKNDPHPFRLYARIMTGFVVVGTLVYWAGSRDWGEDEPELPPWGDVAIIRCEHFGGEGEAAFASYEWENEDALFAIYKGLKNDFRDDVEWQESAIDESILYRLVLISKSGKDLMVIEVGEHGGLFVQGKTLPGDSVTLPTLEQVIEKDSQ